MDESLQDRVVDAVLLDFQRDDWNLKSVADAAIAAVRAHDADLGLESIPTALVDAVASEYLNPEGFNVQRLAKAVGNLVLAYRGDLVRAPVLLGQTEETQP